MKSSSSIIAFFDILGYQAFLKSNSALDAAEKIFAQIQEAPTHAIEALKQPDKKEMRRWNATLATMKKIVFSDTILISVPIEGDEDYELQYVLLCGVSRRIAEVLFQWGLPVRGVITKGQFVFHDTCIAGKAVVDAYALVERLNFSGIILSPELSLHIDTVYYHNREDVWDYSFPYYLCAMNGGEELKTRVVTWKSQAENRNHLAAVRTSFWRWNKDIPSAVDQKVANTAKMLDFFDYHEDTRSENTKDA